MYGIDDEYKDESDSDEDIDWEDAEETLVQGPTSYQDVTISFHNADNEEQPTKGKKRSRYTTQDKKQAIDFHKLELLTLLSRAQLVADWSFDEQVAGCMLSIAPPALFNQQVDQRSLHMLLAWFRTTFQRLPDSMITEEEGCQGAPPTALLRSVENRAASGTMLVQLFVALCSALGIQTRYVVTLDPMVPRPTALKRRRSAASDASLDTTPAQDAEMVEPTTNAIAPYSWVELNLSWPSNSSEASDRRWVAVDCLEAKVDRPVDIETRRLRARRLAYVVAINSSGQVVDVTQRYANRWSKTLESRLQAKHAGWWDHLVQSLCVHNTQTSCGLAADIGAVGVDLTQLQNVHSEAQELKQRIQQEPMPTSLEGFKKHPVYCMEHFLGQTEMLHPRKAVAVFKGRQVFERKYIKPLRTNWQWKRMLRQVLPEHKSQPVKKITRHGVELDLYGEWQTTQYEIPQVVDGVIPRNEYGNVEIWDSDPRLVPAGTVHLPFVGVHKTARELGIEHVEALTGFETKNGRRVPVIEGVVVLEEAAELLLNAFQQKESFSQQKAEEKREARIVKRWEKLVRAAVVREDLRQRYGH